MIDGITYCRNQDERVYLKFLNCLLYSLNVHLLERIQFNIYVHSDRVLCNSATWLSLELYQINDKRSSLVSTYQLIISLDYIHINVQYKKLKLPKKTGITQKKTGLYFHWLLFV